MLAGFHGWEQEEPGNTPEAFAAARAQLRAVGIGQLRAFLTEAGVVHHSGRLNPTNNVFSKLSSRITVDERAREHLNPVLAGTAFVAAYNRPDLDEHWESEASDWVGRASMARRHRMLLLDEADWTYFNVLTFGMGAPDPATALRRCISTLQAMRAAALMIAAHEGDWEPAAVGLYFHVFPSNSVQSLHLHVVDLGATGPTHGRLSYKNTPLDAVLKVLRTELSDCSIPEVVSAAPQAGTRPGNLANDMERSTATSATLATARPDSVALAVALGGGSDSIGALALSRALSHGKVILVQPGGAESSPASGGASGGGGNATSLVECVPIEPQGAAQGAAVSPPGGGWHTNSSMLKYLLSLPPTLCPASAYYLRQQKDAADGKGFSSRCLSSTTECLVI